MSEPSLSAAHMPAMRALWAEAEARRVGGDLAAGGFEAVILRGPAVQRRIADTPAMYMSGDVDVLVRPADRSRMIDRLVHDGFRPLPRSRILDGPATRIMLERRGFTLDLHRGLDLPPYPPRAFRVLEAELWLGARRGPSGFLEPRPEPLAVSLVAHARARAFDPPALRRAARCAASLADPDAMWALAGRAHLTTALRRTLIDPFDGGGLILDGAGARQRRAILTAVHRGSVRRMRPGRLRELAGFRRAGIRVLTPSKREIAVGDLGIQVWEGVCGPGDWTGPLVDAWLRGVAGRRTPVLVDVGTGSGCLAVLAAERWPQAKVHGTDPSPRAVRNARANVANHGVGVRVHRGDLLSALPGSMRGSVDAVVAHLPTLPPGGPTDPADAGVLDAVRLAPPATYQGPGGDGLGLVRRLLKTAPPWLASDGRLVVSMQIWQWEGFSSEAIDLGFRPIRVDHPSTRGAIVTLEAARRDLPDPAG
jgi:release factor glutamine methyltransferase